MSTKALLSIAVFCALSSVAAAHDLPPAMQQRAAKLVRDSLAHQPTAAHAAAVMDSLKQTLDLPTARERVRALITAGKPELKFPDGGRAQLSDQSLPETGKKAVTVWEPRIRNGQASVRFHTFQVRLNETGSPRHDDYPAHTSSLVEEGVGKAWVNFSYAPQGAHIQLYGKAPKRLGGFRYEFERSGHDRVQLLRTLSDTAGERVRLLVKHAPHGTEVMFTAPDRSAANVTLRGPEWTLTTQP